MAKGALREAWSAERATSIEDLQNHGYNNMITTRFSDNGPLLLIATNRDNMNLVEMSREDIFHSIRRGDCVLYELRGGIRALSTEEIADAGVYTPPLQPGFRAEELRERLNNYESAMRDALDRGDRVQALEIGVTQWRYAPSANDAGEMARVFQNVMGMDIAGATPSYIASVRTEQQTRVAEVTEERREAGMATEGQRQADLGLFLSGIELYNSPRARADPSNRDFQVYTAITAFEHMRGYATPEELSTRSREFREATGLDINSQEVREMRDRAAARLGV